MKEHRHGSYYKFIDQPFVECVANSGRPCRPEAHGNIMWHQRCKCGATKKININNSFKEHGAWSEKDKSKGIDELFSMAFHDMTEGERGRVLDWAKNTADEKDRK